MTSVAQRLILLYEVVVLEMQTGNSWTCSTCERINRAGEEVRYVAEFVDAKLSYHSLFSAASEAEDKSTALLELVLAGASPIDEILLKERMLPVSLATAPME